ncbi:HAD-IC family P-type ATPase [Streptomyces sp. ODS28]|uniref:cation-translocating P-type ATPase n=1 Tax=Streptomyces sp. ODS28 TaxID=3136688 RepID=UPI0031E96205
MPWGSEHGAPAREHEADTGPGGFPHAAQRTLAGPGRRPGTPLEVLRRLETGPRGLLEAEAERRLARYGENVLPAQRTARWPRRLARGLRDPFTAMLLLLGLVSASIASWATACVIAVLVAVACGLRAAGEYRADRSVAALGELVATTATVQRRAYEDAAPAPRELPVEQLVPGDVIRLGPGEPVPADVLLLRATGLRVAQEALTGESAPVPKYPADPAGPASAAGPAGREGPAAPAGPAHPAHLTTQAPDDDPVDFDHPELCFQGSSVASGHGTAVVLATGAATRFSGTWRGREPRHNGAFDRSVNGVAWLLIRLMLLAPPAALLADAALRGRGLATVPFTVAVAVGLTPEMLPVVVTTALARGSAVLARSGTAIVKRLPALHDLGAADVLCTDKTGTLSQGRPVLDCALDARGNAAPDVAHWAAMNSMWTLHLAELPAPDALDEALLEAAEPGGLLDTETFAGSPRAGAEAPDALWECEPVAAVPFDPVRRSSCAVVRRPGHTGRHTLIVKGAPEDVLERCARVRLPDADGGHRYAELEGAERERLHALAAEKAGAQGLRLLAVAVAERPARLRPYTPADENGLDFLGFVGLRDALTPTAAEALASLAEQGVEVKVLTGDHPGTAARVCRELGLYGGEPGCKGSADHPALTGADIDRLGDAELSEAAARTTLFARCTPEHKARVVTALRGSGRTTGFLGDGVNDLPAVRAADVGLCPRDAAPATREAADVVLAAKNLTSIGSAVAAGRTASGNVATYLRTVLSSNLGNVIAMLAAGLLLPFLPMYPAQVLVQNLCFDAAQLAFAFDRPAPGSLRAPAVLHPRALLRFITRFGLLNAAADLATFGVLALTVPGSLAPGGEVSFHSGWFTENLLTQAMVMLLLRSGRGAPGTPLPVRLAVAGLAVSGLLLPLTPLASPLGLSPLPPAYYALLALVLAVYGYALARCAGVWNEREHGRRAQGVTACSVNSPQGRKPSRR